MFESDLMTTIEQSQAQMRSELAALFQVTVSLLSFNDAVVGTMESAEEFCTALLWATSGGWIGSRRPDAI